MKTQNNNATLINPLSPSLYNAYKQWYHRSLFFIFFLCSALMSYSSYQYWQLYILKKKIILPAVDAKIASGQEIAQVQKRLVTLQEYSQSIAGLEEKKSLFTMVMHALIAQLPDSVCLTSFEYNHGNFTEITGKAHSLAAVTQFWQRLQEIPAFKRLQLTKMKPLADTEHKECITFLLQQ